LRPPCRSPRFTGVARFRESESRAPSSSLFGQLRIPSFLAKTNINPLLFFFEGGGQHFFSSRRNAACFFFSLALNSPFEVVSSLDGWCPSLPISANYSLSLLALDALLNHFSLSIRNEMPLPPEAASFRYFLFYFAISSLFGSRSRVSECLSSEGNRAPHTFPSVISQTRIPPFLSSFRHPPN